MLPLTAHLSGTTGWARQSQNGLKFETICRSCNSHLGIQYDPTVIGFAATVTRCVNALIALPRSVQVAVKVQRLMKGVVGHLLAAEVDYRSTFFSEWASNYVLDPAAKLPKAINIFFWLHDGPESLAVTDLIKYSLRHGSEHVLHALKFPPLGFLITSDRMYDGLPSLSRHRAAHPDDEVVVRVPLRARRPADWPEAPSDADGTISLFGGGAANAIRATILTADAA
ncbi:MAG: hypothetical protein F4X98_12310 [Gammaproteobacteria bacterium]|nr:hypothetical protein [Gammaproteobacteria bacterium]